MPTVKVYGNKPDTGPKRLSAGVVRDDINQVHPAWAVTMVWTADNTTYTSATAGGDDLEGAVQNKLPGYNYLLT
jgi:hypothetical protein